MNPTDLASLGQLAQALGVVGLLAVAVAALWRGWVVTRGHHADVCAELRAQTQFWREQYEQERAAGQQLLAHLIASNDRMGGVTEALKDLREAVREIARMRAA